jgi:hypothetical protein
MPPQSSLETNESIPFESSFMRAMSASNSLENVAMQIVVSSFILLSSNVVADRTRKVRIRAFQGTVEPIVLSSSLNFNCHGVQGGVPVLS